MGSLLHWEVNKLQLNYPGIGFQLVIAPNGSGIQCMQGNLGLRILVYVYCVVKHSHSFSLIVLNIQQASKLAHKGAGGIGLGKAVHFWKGL